MSLLGLTRRTAAALLMLGSLGLVADAVAAETFTVTDLAGREVEIPRGANRIILGEGRMFYATVVLDREKPFEQLAAIGDDLGKFDPDTWNLSPAAAAAAITPRTRVLLPVHYAGRPAAIAAFRDLAAAGGLTLIEDAAHAVEAVTAGRKIGAICGESCEQYIDLAAAMAGDSSWN